VPATKAPKKAPTNGALKANYTPNQILSGVIGPEPRPLAQMMKDLWVYIKSTTPPIQESRNIHSDNKLQPLFNTLEEGTKTIGMHQIPGLLSKNSVRAQ
jgi:chromatin remodeling complex protein RSC6